MKKKSLILSLCCAFIVSGCSNAEKADKKMVCFLSENKESGYYTNLMYIDYNSKSMVATKQIVSKNYTDLAKNNENNVIVAELSDRQSKYFETEGILIDFELTDSSLNYTEYWDYTKLALKDALDVDTDQEKMIDGDHYSAEMIRDYYRDQGYSCDMDSDMKFEKK